MYNHVSEIVGCKLTLSRPVNIWNIILKWLCNGLKHQIVLPIMKQLNKSLGDFITTFELEHPTKGICFEANIYFFAGRLTIQAGSEIHIVTINGKGLDVLYILSTTIGIKDFPTMFVIGDFEVSFSKQQGLKLNGISPKWGSFTLIVQPTGKDCKIPTYKELHAKVNN